MNRCRDCNTPVGNVTPQAWRCASCELVRRKHAGQAANRRARDSRRARQVCWDAHHWLEPVSGQPRLTCHVCECEIDPVRKRWEADHISRHAEDGPDTAANLLPICIPCHRVKSAGDTTAVAKGKRWAAKHYGVKRSSRPMAGSRASGWRRRMNGSVERR